ncbi:G-type lectin S-receptor-like serine/threonine-protein kinase SD1-1 [Glycine soja]
MNPKISDFGLAPRLWGDQVDANTNKIAGTYGYMPPDYAVHGHFSMKSDVFSFGVMVLEIRPVDRPDMSAVVLRLNGEKSLPQPKALGFYNGRDKADLYGPFSNNYVSLTVFEPR